MTELTYPIELDRDAIERVLPHRGEALFVHSVQILAHNNYIGQVKWPAGLAVMQGHFPGMPVVPGVLLVEATAQVAGAGLLAGDPYARSMEGDRIGLLAGIRKCTFKRPVLPDQWVRAAVHSRQMSATAAQITATLTVADEEVATIEILVVNMPKQDVLSHLQPQSA